MGQRYDTVMALHVRVRAELEQIASDPKYTDPAAAMRQIDHVLEDEFTSLAVHAATMPARDVVSVLGSSARTEVYAQLLMVRTMSLAAASRGDDAKRQARRLLEIVAENALAHGALVLEPDVIEQLRSLMGELQLSSTHAQALEGLIRGRY